MTPRLHCLRLVCAHIQTESPIARSVIAWYLFAVAVATHQPLLADHIEQPAVDRLRTPMEDEGYLEYQLNPLFSRFGEEWTGWTDIRHPSMAGATNVTDPFDRSDSFVNVQTTILTDATGAVAPSSRATDFDFANKAYMLQAGVSVIETGSRGIASGPGGAGMPPKSTFPLVASDLLAISMFHNAPAHTIDLYYAQHTAGLLGATRIPTNGNPYIFVDNNAIAAAPAGGFPDTFAHELFHFIGDQNGARRRTTRVGGVDQLTSAQAVQIFADADVMPWFPATQRGDNHEAGHRVDWDWVVDHGSRTIDNDFDDKTATRLVRRHQCRQLFSTVVFSRTCRRHANQFGR